MPHFLVKTEPGDYSFADLAREKSCLWSGVSNPGALAHLRAMRPGDECFVYHTGDEKAVVGLAAVASEPFEDPKRPGLNERGEPRFPVVKLAAVRRAATPLTLAAVKADPRFAELALVRQSRLSVMPVPPPLAKIIRGLTGL